MSNIADWIIEKAAKWLSKEIESKRKYLSNFEKISEIIKPADVILVEGSTRVSYIIKLISRSQWSHAALYIGRLQDIKDSTVIERIKKHYQGPDNEPLLIESRLGKGTIITPLHFYENDHIRICRPSSLTEEDGEKVIVFAINHLGKSYSVRHILDLMRFLFPWKLFPRRWSSGLFSHNALKPTEEICSYMIAQSFMSVDYPILPLIEKKEQTFELTKRNPKLFTPGDFDYSPFFEIIKFSNLGQPGQILYRDLNWKRDKYVE